MGSAVKAVTKPFEWVGKAVTKPFKWVGHAASNVISSIGGLLTPKMPEIPNIEAPPAEPAGPGASASESSEAQAERRRVLAAKGKKKTRTMLTSAQGVTEDAGVGKKRLLGE